MGIDETTPLYAVGSGWTLAATKSDRRSEPVHVKQAEESNAKLEGLRPIPQGDCQLGTWCFSYVPVSVCLGTKPWLLNPLFGIHFFLESLSLESIFSESIFRSPFFQNPFFQNPFFFLDSIFVGIHFCWNPSFSESMFAEFIFGIHFGIHFRHLGNMKFRKMSFSCGNGEFGWAFEILTENVCACVSRSSRIVTQGRRT